MNTENEMDKNLILSEKESENTTEIVTPELLNLDYRYIRLLGEGANGRTWLARERKTGLNVAVKELKFVEDFKSFELFQREAEVLKSIKVEGVPRYIDSIFTPDMTGYIIQEYITAPSLESFLEKGELFDEEEVYLILELTSKILFALQTQYIPAIIHRDIKPGNILYQRATANEEAKVWLIDFGAVDNAHKQSSGSTIAGTFGYMSPEQLQGEVSPRSDFYSLGATALHLLTGVFPYEIPSELFALKFHPVIEEKAPDTTKPMVNFLDKLLASSAEKRPQDIKQLRTLLFEASIASQKYRQINTIEIPDYPAKTKLGRKFRKTKLGTMLHQHKMNRIRRRFEKRRLKQIRRLEKEEAKAAKIRLEEERRLQQERERKGIELTASVQRVAVAGTLKDSIIYSGLYLEEIRQNKLDENILEGIFTHEGNWYPAYVRINNIKSVQCTLDAPENLKVSENTFKVLFIPDKMDITLSKDQELWLSEEYYTKFTGLLPKCKQKERDRIVS